MKWSIEKDDGHFFLSINGARAKNLSGKQNELQTAGLGNTKTEIWLKFKDEKWGKRFSRSEFGGQGDLGVQLQMCQTNGQFLKELQSAGLTITTREPKDRNGRGRGRKPDLEYPDKDPLPNQQWTDLFKDKCTGTKTIDLDSIKPTPEEHLIRHLSTDWVSQLKRRLRGDRTGLVTTIPVMKHDEGYFTIGGNHITTAARQLLEEDNEHFAHLRFVNVRTYDNLSDTEIKKMAALHNLQTDSKKLSFQERVKLARAVKNQEGDNWQKEATATLSLLDGKRHTINSLSTILSAANLSPDCWTSAEQLFKEFEVVSNTSFPYQLFKQLQAVRCPVKKLAYLRAAIGTNGLKTARTIEEDKQKANVKELTLLILEAKDWEEVTILVGPDNAQRILDYKGNLTTTEGRQRLRSFIETLQAKGEDSYELKLYENGKDISAEHSALLKVQLQTLLKKMKTED